MNDLIDSLIKEVAAWLFILLMLALTLYSVQKVALPERIGTSPGQGYSYMRSLP